MNDCRRSLLNAWTAHAHVVALSDGESARANPQAMQAVTCLTAALNHRPDG